VDAKQESLNQGRRRRRHSAEFKAKLIGICLEPGVSVALTARNHGVNANLLHRWITTHQRNVPVERQIAAPHQVDQFVPVQLTSPRPPAPTAEIRIELRRGATTVNVSWPIEAADDCANWLRAWLC